jgi:hypothetical protein
VYVANSSPSRADDDDDDEIQEFLDLQAASNGQKITAQRENMFELHARVVKIMEAVGMSVVNGMVTKPMCHEWLLKYHCDKNPMGKNENVEAVVSYMQKLP